ncbi:M14 family zinc carboxypeptidase [Salinibacterium sp. SYSU T00001]|uniref:M14 family zinc carboxypeptidase n=1 Tax=Homoserinimonas sedimenticola TaxID=2986805 RepID=UPI002235DC59|nr:M14 family zinc carboxypeptidase [Salinibacterium sedimenticola]MCW4384693.1 M14 family zinc carboxypeptidase [Salinibacterium sedimenticola]
MRRSTEVGSPEDILRRAASAPDHSNFPTVDELVAGFDALEAAHPGLITSQRIGTSRLGEPIRMYSIGADATDGISTLSHLVVGGVHPNEPIGAWTATHLLQQLAEDAGLREGLGARWHIIPCIDPDGARLNEAWFKRPGERSHYARNFYRPAPDEQVEWTFPFAYKRAYFDRVLPETQALMRAIDSTRPDLYVALHNGEMGGVYYYLTREEPGLYEMLHRIPAHLGVPLDKGEPESAHLEPVAPAIFVTGPLEEVYDWLESLGVDPFPPGSGGDASSSYARRYGTLSLIAELPYWKHRDADDTSPVDESYASLLARTGAVLRDAGHQLAEVLEQASPELTLDTPMLRASRAFVPMVAATGLTNIARGEQPETARPATAAERAGCLETVHMYRLRYGGMLLRALSAECAAGTATHTLRRLVDELEMLYSEWLADAAVDDADAEVIPVSTLVGVQYGAILAAAAHLAAGV